MNLGTPLCPAIPSCVTTTHQGSQGGAGLTRHQLYYRKNKEKRLAYNRERYTKNRARILLRQKRYRESHPDQQKKDAEMCKKRYWENPEKYRATSRDRQKNYYKRKCAETGNSLWKNRTYKRPPEYWKSYYSRNPLRYAKYLFRSGTLLKSSDVPDEIAEAKAMHIKLKRTLHENK